MKEFHDLADFDSAQIEDLLKLARQLQDHPEPQALAGKVLALLFMSPSLRTLASFQAAMARLGGGSFVISPEMSIHGINTTELCKTTTNDAEQIVYLFPVRSREPGQLSIEGVGGSNLPIQESKQYDQCILVALLLEQAPPQLVQGLFISGHRGPQLNHRPIGQP